MYKLSKIILCIVIGLAGFSTLMALWHTVLPQSMRWMSVEDIHAISGLATVLDIIVIFGAVAYFVNNNPNKKSRDYDW